MGDANHIRTLEDYSKPSHEGYRNTIELPVRNNVVPLRSDTIRFVQNGFSFHGLRFEDPNQHLKDFLKLVDSLDLDGENRERTRLHRMAGALPNDTVKNSKLNVNTKTLVLSARSYPTKDPQCSSYPSTSINAVKTCSKEASHSQTSLLQTGMRIGTEQNKEPKSTLEDEFQDLHLSLPVL
ncbi:hypothetical protein Tco_0622825 [Tanacetum coccineum]